MRSQQTWDDALAAVVARRGELVGYATLLVGERMAAHELVRDAIVRTFARRRGWHDGAEALRAVRGRMVARFLGPRRHAIATRALARLRGEEDGVGDDAPPAGPRAVTGALWMLDRRQRACVVLRHVDGMSVEEVADVLGEAPSEVSRRLELASAILARELRRVPRGA